MAKQKDTEPREGIRINLADAVAEQMDKDHGLHVGGEAFGFVIVQNGDVADVGRNGLTPAEIAAAIKAALDE